MAHVWLEFLKAMRPNLQSVYGNSEAVDNLIAQVKNDYSNPNLVDIISCIQPT